MTDGEKQCLNLTLHDDDLTKYKDIKISRFEAENTTEVYRLYYLMMELKIPLHVALLAKFTGKEII